MPSCIGLVHFIFEKTREFSQQVSKMKKRFVKVAAVVAGAVIIAVSATVFMSMQRGKKLQAEVTKGVEVIRNMEAVDATQIENRIRQMEEDELRNTEEYKNRPINVKYEDSLILGDSQAEAFLGYKILDDSEVIAHKGAHIKEISDSFDTVVNLNPKNIFLTYGVNDLGMYGSKEDFVAVYKQEIQKLQAELPNTKFYVNLIFPVTDAAIAQQSHLARWQSFNEGIKEMCGELGITCIDSNSLVTADCYEPDGIHMVYSFYGSWAEYMAEVANL